MDHSDNWIDLQSIPTKVWGDGFRYDWKRLTSWFPIKFKYNELSDVMLIRYCETNKGGTNFLELNYEGCTYVINVYSFMKVSLANFFNLIPISKPYMMKYFKGGFKSAREFTYANQVKGTMVCPNCKTDKQMRVADLYNDGFNCGTCSKHISYPERFTVSLLKVLGFEYETQKVFEGSNWRFDFYIPYLELVVEVHGKQHFVDAWGSKEDVIKNDSAKRKFIKFELGLNYSAVDISRSTAEYAWKMLSQSILGDYMLNVEYNDVVTTCNESNYNEDYNNIVRDYKHGLEGTQIADKYNVSHNTVYRILRRSGTIIRNNTTEVRCVSTGDTYGSIMEAETMTGVGRYNISANCRGVQKTAGTGLNGQPLVWEYIKG